MPKAIPHKYSHNPETAISTALSERDRHRFLYERNSTRAEFPDVCVHELFERQVDRDPDAVAVVFQEQRLTYGELNRRANRLAHSLRKRGVVPETLVGVCLERSPEMLIALLGVWKAGGAYVPLDPSYPAEQLAFMAGDAAIKILLTNEKCRGLAVLPGVAAVCLDTDWPAIAQESGGNPSAVATASNLAYVMYTSGSTGRPKGAMIEHRGLVNYLCWVIETYEVAKGSSVPVHSSIAYDSTVASLYPPLLAGRQVELLPEDVGAQSLVAALRRKKNRGKVVITPSHLEVLNLQLSAEEMADASKILVIAGETLHAESLSPWRDFAPATRLFNDYGPTEATVGCCAYEVRAEDPRNGPVLIGRPIANAQVYVLDDEMQPVAPGAVGELYVGGAGVARGYLNRPELTREKFLADPFSDRNDARLYKTGDLARYREDGMLECLGRVDDQVKLRGYRIELGEIEAVLAGHPDVQSCAVLLREDIPGNKQLVGYVVARGNNQTEADGLRKFLRQRLPEYMVPAHFVFLDSIPLTKNGKSDRKVLPAPSPKRISRAQGFRRPQTETEKKLASIWMNLLKVEHLEIQDDFFDLGGTSLLAIRAMSQIQEEFGVVPSMQTFFSSTTLAALAEALTGLEDYRDQLAYAVPFQANGTKLPFYFIGAGARASLLSAQLGPNQPFFGIDIEPKIVAQLMAPYRTEEIAKYFVLALRGKQPRGPYVLGGFCMTAVFAYEVARQLTVQGEDVGLLVLFEPMNPCQSAKVRFMTGFRRMVIRLGFRFGELRRQKIRELPAYAGNRWKNLMFLLRDLRWRICAHPIFLSRQFGSQNLERILFLAASSYEPKPLGCPTVIFRAKDSPMQAAGDPYFGWRDFLMGHSETHEIPGNHVGIFQEPNVRILAEKLRVCLQKATQLETHSDELIVDQTFEHNLEINKTFEKRAPQIFHGDKSDRL